MEIKVSGAIEKLKRNSLTENSMNLIVLSNKQQYKSFAESGLDMEQSVVLCDNPGLYDFLRKRGVNFEILDEELLKDEWDDINAWACRKALFFGELINDEMFRGIEINKALYVYFTYYLVGYLKNYIYAEIILKKYSPSEIVVFDQEEQPDFPRFDGNVFLNILLADMAKVQDVETSLLTAEYGATQARKFSCKEYLRNVLELLYSRFASHRVKKHSYMVCGSLNHLAPVLEGLKDRGEDVFLYDIDFCLDQLKFCLKRRLEYFVPRMFCKNDSFFRKNEATFYSDLNKTLSSLRAKRWFEYKGRDLGSLLSSQISDHCKGYIENISKWTEIYGHIIRGNDLRGIVVDEDWSPERGFMTAFFKSRGVRTYCISHGYGAKRFELGESDQKFFLSETFVHTEYEKNVYASKGWKKDHLHVTGTPRYDRLAGMTKTLDKKNESKMKLLFCSGPLSDYNPREASYIGVAQFEFGRYMKDYLRDLIEVVKEYDDVEILVRPHPYLYDEDSWNAIIDDMKGDENVKLCSPRSDFFEVLTSCDALLLGYWSTAVVEAIIAGIPTMVIDYTGMEDGHDFAREGLCKVARSIDDTKNMLDDMRQTFFLNESPSAAVREKQFFVGRNDKKNTTRVLDIISAKKIKENSNTIGMRSYA